MQNNCGCCHCNQLFQDLNNIKPKILGYVLYFLFFLLNVAASGALVGLEYECQTDSTIPFLPWAIANLVLLVVTFISVILVTWLADEKHYLKLQYANIGIQFTYSFILVIMASIEISAGNWEQCFPVLTQLILACHYIKMFFGPFIAFFEHRDKINKTTT